MRDLSGVGLISVAALSGLTACSTLDEYLIEDPAQFDDEVVIVGGGIGGLYAAYQLKKNRVPFRLFEASGRLGGRILSTGDYEWGANEFSVNDHALMKLAKELNLERIRLDNENWVFKNGSESLTDGVIDIVKGLLPNRQIRTQHRLSTCRQLGNVYQLDFQTPTRERTYFAKKVILALPALAYKNIRGLDDIAAIQKVYVRLINVDVKETVRVVLPAPRDFKLKSRYMIELENDVQVSQRLYKNNIHFTFESPASKPFRSLPEIEKYLSQNVYVQTRTKVALQDSQIFDWLSHPSIGGGSFELKQAMTPDAWPKGRLQIISDCLSYPVSRVEGVLRQVDQQLRYFI